MIKLLVTLLKIIGFSAIVLVLANRIEWNGKTISDQVRMQMSHAENSDVVKELRNTSEKIVRDVKEGALKKLKLKDSSAAASPAAVDEEFTDSERAKLRALIQELNHTAMN